MEQFPEKVGYVNKMAAIWERFAKLALNGDFYALTPNHHSNREWTVFQFDIPETGEGVFQVLRNNQSDQESITVYPEGIGESRLILVNDETGESFIVNDIEKTGITFTQPVRTGAIWFYTR